MLDRLMLICVYVLIGIGYAVLSQFGRNLKWYRVAWMALLWPLCILFRVDTIEWRD